MSDTKSDARQSNIAVGLFFYLAGVITPALFSTDTLRERLAHWIPLG